MDHHLAELNVARLRRPLDAPEAAEFVASLDPINVIAETTPGFIWRLTDDDGRPSSFIPIPGLDDPLVIVNYSIWRDLESLKHYVYKSGHASYLRRRNDWFEPTAEASVVCWWTPAGVIPDLADAYARLQDLRNCGPSDRGWPLNKPIDPPTRR
jgi:hypothetical protein